MSTVLLVDDDGVLRKLLDSRLRYEGFLTIPLDSFSLAYDIITKGPVKIDAFLLDVMMPGELTVEDIIKEIRLSDKYKNKPVLIVSGVDKHRLKAIAELFKVTVVSKPIILSDLINHVKKLTCQV